MSILKKLAISLFLLALFFLTLKNSYSFMDPDLGWHLGVGRQILATKAVPRIENINFPLIGKSWVDHEWLSNLISYLLYANIGYFWLSVIFAIIPILAALALLVHIKKIYALPTTFYAYLVLAFGLFGSLPHFGVRMQELTFLFLALEIFVCDLYITRKKTIYLIALPVLLFIWANMHGGFLVGMLLPMFILGLKSIEAIIYLFSDKIKIFTFETLLNFRQLVIFFIFALSAIFATLLTPYGFGLYDFLKTYSNNFYLYHIEEWLPIYYFKINFPQPIYMSMVAAIFLIYSLNRFYLKNKSLQLDFYKLGLIALFTYMAIKSRRHFPLFFIVSFPYFIYLSHQLFIKDIATNFKTKISYPLIVSFLLVTLVSLNIYFVRSTYFAADPFKSYCNFYPCLAIGKLKDIPGISGKKIFNEYGWGGYLYWTMPGQKFFIDGRLPQYPVNGKSFLEEDMAFYAEGKSQEKLDEYAIDLIFLKKNYIKSHLNWFEKYFFGLNENEINNRPNYLNDYLATTTKWQMVYDDATSAIYKRK